MLSNPDQYQSVRLKYGGSAVGIGTAFLRIFEHCKALLNIAEHHYALLIAKEIRDITD